ncbi:MAG: hypothetical protein ACHP8B_04865 [Terriglobales bacterium]
MSDKIAIDSSSWMCKVLVLTLGLCVFLSACKAPPVSSAESKSPDGRLVATAHTFANSGLGGGPPTTFVYLNWATGSRPPVLILSLTGGSDTSVDKNVEMKWLNSTHLELKYNKNQTVDFQAIKWGDVDLSLRDGTSEKPQARDLKNERRSLPTPPPFAYKKTAASQSQATESPRKPERPRVSVEMLLLSTSNLSFPLHCWRKVG